MDQGERETSRLWRVHKTIHHMVHDRGYIVSQAELDMALAEFVQTYGSGGVVVEYSIITIYVEKHYILVVLL
jgi:DNA-directed RNA polymerase I, II, and III subunit RPABC1